MKTNYYIGVPVKNDEKRYYFLCCDDCFIAEYFLESDKFHALSFSDEKSAREWIEEYYPFPNNREINIVWDDLSTEEKENFDWATFCILKETWEVIEP